MKQVLESIGRWNDAGIRCALAIVTKTWGSSPRQPGSVMAVNNQGEMTGSVSGGCVESSVLLEALDCLETNQPKTTSFLASHESAHHVGLPCGGSIEIAIIPLSAEEREAVANCAQENTPFEMALLFDESRLPQGLAILSDTQQYASEIGPDVLAQIVREIEANDACLNTAPINLSAGSNEILVCRYGARLQLVCVGAVHIALDLVKLAKTMDYRTIVIDPRRAFATDERLRNADVVIREWPEKAFQSISVDSRTAICALTHDEKLDVPALKEALKTDAFYIGSLGKPSTQQARLEKLLDDGVDPNLIKRINGPIGLPLGGREPSDIALGILAQISACYHDTLQDFGPQADRKIAS